MHPRLGAVRSLEEVNVCVAVDGLDSAEHHPPPLGKVTPFGAGAML